METAQIALKAELSTFDLEDVRLVLSSTLQQAVSLARARRDAYERACRQFETRYEMMSAEFMRRFEAGTLGDEADYFDWYAAKRAWDLWDRRARILAGVSL
jgi:hypothetical protein